MSSVNLPASLFDMFQGINDRLNRLELGYSGPQATADAAQSTATTASATAVAAQTTANGAQTTANGKNKITYSTSTPGSTANSVGDIWWQYTTGGVIIGQWSGAGGTTWTSAPIGNLVIANIDAGKITTGILDATLVTVTTSATATNSITFSGANTSIDFKVTNPVAHIIPYAGGGSAVGVLMHYGTLADPGGNTFPQTFAIQASAGIAGSSTYSIISTPSGNAINGGVQLNGMTQAAITGAQGNTYRAVTTNGTNGSLYYGYNVYYASGGDPTVTSPTDSKVGDIYFSY